MTNYRVVLAASSFVLAAGFVGPLPGAYAAAAAQGQHASSSTRAAMRDLQGAAQRLRESIQAMAQEQPGPKREQAMKAAHEALFDTNQAMVRLPVEYRGRAFTWSQSNAAKRPTDQTYEQTLQELRKASDRLYDAVHAMARESGSSGRKQAIEQANEALIETHTAMAWAFDKQLTSSGTPNSGTSSSASTTSAARGSLSTQAAGGSVSGPNKSQDTRASASAVAGGVGINARARLSDQAAPEHNVKLVFALDTGNYVADVHVTVKNKSNKTVIDGDAHGPWLYAKLPAGTYNATASYEGQTITQQFTVGRGGQRVAYFRWPASIEASAAGVQPILGSGPEGR